MKEAAEGLRLGLEGDKAARERAAAEGEARERALREEIQRAKHEVNRQEGLVSEAREQVATVRAEQNAKFSEFLSVQQKLNESELRQQFLSKDRAHLTDLLEQAK